MLAASPQQQNAYDCGVYVLGTSRLASCITLVAEYSIVTSKTFTWLESQGAFNCQGELKLLMLQPWRTSSVARGPTAWPGNRWTRSCERRCRPALPPPGALIC